MLSGEETPLDHSCDSTLSSVKGYQTWMFTWSGLPLFSLNMLPPKKGYDGNDSCLPVCQARPYFMSTFLLMLLRIDYHLAYEWLTPLRLTWHGETLSAPVLKRIQVCAWLTLVLVWISATATKICSSQSSALGFPYRLQSRFDHVFLHTSDLVYPLSSRTR